MATHLSDSIVNLFNKLLCDVIREQNSIEFTLPQLFEKFSQQDEKIAELNLTDFSYKEFRKALFNSPVNEEVKKRGGEIVIKENMGKVDESVYCLKMDYHINS